jgi:hypothetical protein
MSHRAFLALEPEARFYARRSGALKFRIDVSGADSMPLRKRYAHYVVHPHLPFIITLQWAAPNHLANTNMHFPDLPDPCPAIAHQ